LQRKFEVSLKTCADFFLKSVGRNTRQPLNFIAKSMRMRWVGHITRKVRKKNAYRLLVGKPQGKRQLGRPRQVDGSWRDRMGYIDWIGLARDSDKWRAFVSAVMSLRA
jgi:hypothetical protein